jgi:1-acyl-sn-glycerol-3-phosphate acyltransferase
MTENPSGPTDVLGRMETPLFRALHQSLYLFYHVGFTLGFSFRMQGQRNMLPAGPALIVANHQSFLDPLIIGLVARRPLVYLARKTLFDNPLFGALIRSLNAVPIDQEGIGKEGIRVVLEQLKLGKAVVVFPEGERTLTGHMLPLKPGILLLIKRTRAPIIPVGISGAYDAWPRWRTYPLPAPLCLPARPGAISVSLGAALDPHRFADLPREQALQELFDKIHDEEIRAEKLRRR